MSPVLKRRNKGKSQKETVNSSADKFTLVNGRKVNAQENQDLKLGSKNTTTNREEEPNKEEVKVTGGVE